MGKSTGDCMTAVERWLPSMEASDMPRLAQTLRNMIAACIAPSAEHSILAREEIEGSLLKRVRRTVRDPSAVAETATSHALPGSRDLPVPALPPVRTCGRRRQVYSAATNAAYHALLSDPTNQRPIVAIARDFCFEDASGFSRAFRKEFGFNASDVRSAAMAGIPLTLAVQTELEAEAVRFADLFGNS